MPSQPWKCKPAKTRQHFKPGHTTTARCAASCPFHECKQCTSHLASISDMALWPDGQGIGTKDCRFESCQNHFFNHVHSFPSLIHFHEKPCHLSFSKVQYQRRMPEHIGSCVTLAAFGRFRPVGVLLVDSLLFAIDGCCPIVDWQQHT